jgi:hypothetical protein
VVDSIITRFHGITHLLHQHSTSISLHTTTRITGLLSSEWSMIATSSHHMMFRVYLRASILVPSTHHYSTLSASPSRLPPLSSTLLHLSVINLNLSSRMIPSSPIAITPTTMTRLMMITTTTTVTKIVATIKKLLAIESIYLCDSEE